ncbi:SpoIIE family protein phosphatase [Robertmurraya sp.]|uniref:SpoIIE family protein phosphatase n=1 Tax=Robertmurraya sp. TaxID=2837525 RepID=UPI0037039F9C
MEQSLTFKKNKRFSQAVIDSQIYQIAIINQLGDIISTNFSWKHFCKENNGNIEKCDIGNNYFTMSPSEIAKGIKDVLSGKLNIFSYEYPCHSPLEIRWFNMDVTPLIVNEESRKIDGAVITHKNITERKLLELSLQKDLKLAKSIQESILVPALQEEEIKIEGLYLPSEYLSGDMYAWFKIDKHLYGVILLDIMGHGVSSSLISMSMRSLLPGIITRVTDPVKVYNELNKHFYSLFRTLNSQRLYFCTGIYLLIDTKKQKINYLNAGHPSGVVLSRNKDQFLDNRVPPIGLMESPKVSSGEVKYSKNDRVILYTDGIFDSMDMNLKNFENFLLNTGKTKYQHYSLSEISTIIKNNINQKDDISILSIQL